MPELNQRLAELRELAVAERRDRVGWLRAMIAEYRDSLTVVEDSQAGWECVHACTLLANELEAELPAVEAQPVVVVDREIPF